jgi:hypothetical protein
LAENTSGKYKTPALPDSRYLRVCQCRRVWYNEAGMLLNFALAVIVMLVMLDRRALRINFDGILLGAGALIIIGILHPVVIKAEFHIGAKAWPLFLLAGLICVGFSLFCDAYLLRALLAVLGFSFLWGIREILEQEKRVQKGWFPANPKKALPRDPDEPE